MSAERDKQPLITRADFLELPGVGAVAGGGGRVMLYVEAGWVEPYTRYFSSDGPGRERCAVNALVYVLEHRDKPPLGLVRYMPTHNHAGTRPCDAGCPVFDWERHVLRHGDPYNTEPIT